MDHARNQPAGLRERKRERTRQAISEAAITLFLRDGFDQVSVAQIAATAEISKPTLFKYFPTKEDLVVHRFADHQDEAAQVVTGRPAGQAPLAALHAHFLAGLARRDPVTGLNDHPQVLAFQRLVHTTDSLAARLTHYTARSQALLAEALARAGVEELTAELLAAQVLAVQRVLALRNWRQLAAGADADQLYPRAVADADRAFTLLRATT